MLVLQEQSGQQLRLSDCTQIKENLRPIYDGNDRKKVYKMQKI